jgi:hypothetical protein
MMKRLGISTTGRLLAVLVSVLLCSNALARIKTDVVWLINGDRITGEIKQLEYGKVRLDTESMGEIRIDWQDVARIESDYPFQFERTDGTRITGNISETGDQGEITLTNDFRTMTFAHNKVVRIAPIEDSFWDRLKGSMSFGYSFTKASNVAQGNLGIRATHRTEERAFSLDGTTILTNDQVDTATQSSSLRLDMTRFKETAGELWRRHGQVFATDRRRGILIDGRTDADIGKTQSLHRLCNDSGIDSHPKSQGEH